MTNTIDKDLENLMEQRKISPSLELELSIISTLIIRNSYLIEKNTELLKNNTKLIKNIEEKNKKGNFFKKLWQ